MISKFTIAVVLLTISAAYTARLPKPAALPLISVGSIGGKEFSIGQEEISWAEGRSLCEQNGQEMAEVHGAEEIEFLKKNLWTNEDRFSHYFTSGRSEPVWAKSQVVIGDSIGPIEDFAEIECVSIRGGSPYDTLFELRLCSEIWPPLCQKKA